MAGHRRLAAALLACTVAVLAAATPPARADYGFVVEPTYPPDQAQEVYKPLIAYLAKATGEKFKLVTPRTYHFYWRDIGKTDGIDFAFDEAHLADYRIQRFKFVPLVRTVESTSYTLVTNTDLGSKGVDGLIGKKIVTMPAPSLGYALLAAMYPNPIKQPDIESIADSWHDAIEIVYAGEAEAAIVPSFWMANRSNMIAIKTSKSFPGPSVTAAPSVPETVREKVKDALLKIETDPDVANLLVELGITRFVAATAADYVGSEQMLKDFYGYK